MSPSEKFCQEHGCTPESLSEMRRLTEASARAYCRNDTASENRYAQKVEKIALSIGFQEVQWNGLYPTLMKDGYSYHLPD